MNVPIAFDITSDRVQHYEGVIEHMANIEIQRFHKEHGTNPAPSQIQFYKKELARLMIINKDIKTAQTIKIAKSNILNENYSISPRL